MGDVSVEDGSESFLELWEGLAGDSLEDNECLEGSLLSFLGISDSGSLGVDKSLSFSGWFFASGGELCAEPLGAVFAVLESVSPFVE